jgi:hypothetical protein
MTRPSPVPTSPALTAAVLTAADLPLAELTAARLDGEVYRLDGVFCIVDSPEFPALRAEAIVRRWPSRLIAERHSAAWVLGALDAPPSRHELCADVNARARPTTLLDAHVREVVLDPEDVVRVGRLDVTSPARTVIDLARFSDRFDVAERAICERLLRGVDGGRDHCRDLLDRRRNLPNKKRAWERIRSLELSPS